MKLETKRLLLRPFSPEDAKDFYAYAKHPDVGPAAGWSPHQNIDETKNILKMFLTSDDTIFAIVLKETGKVIGSVGLHTDSHRPRVPNCKMLGYVLSADYWGMGLMTEAAHAVIDYAFSDENLELLTCSHFPSNKRSARVIEKCGFHYEGLLRHAYLLITGKVADSCTYSMTRAEYLDHKQQEVSFESA